MMFDTKLIKTKCYGQEEVWLDRNQAINFFLEGMRSSEGSERDRYTSIYFQLLDGNNYCTDEELYR